MQGSSTMRLCVAIVFRYPSYRIRVHNSHLGFGVHSKIGLGTKVILSTSFHPQTDGQAKHTIHTLEDKLRDYIIHFKGNWDNYLPLVEFAYNNSFHSSVSIAPYEALYGKRCRSLIVWFEVGKSFFWVPI